MSQYYIDLPGIYRSYLKEEAIDIINDNRSKWNHLEYHDLFRLPRNEILTPAGLDRFVLYSWEIDVFRVPPKFSARVHIDKSYHAFNYVLTNNGAMEWFELRNLVEINKSEWGTSIFEHPSVDPLVKTTSNMMWVNTKIPHRIVNESDSG